MGQGGIACPKPEPRKRVKGRKDRAEAKVKKSVRAQCVDRDGYCRLNHYSVPFSFGMCKGASQWAHLGDKKRFKTRGQSPEQRHSTWGSLMLCDGHHDAYDLAKMRIRILTPFGADGPLEFTYDGVNYIDHHMRHLA